MVLAAVVGLVVGILAIVPLAVSARKARHISVKTTLDMLAPFLITMIISFVVLIGGLFACKLLASDVLVPFAIAEFVSFVIGLIVFGLSTSKRR